MIRKITTEDFEKTVADWRQKDSLVIADGTEGIKFLSLKGAKSIIYYSDKVNPYEILETNKGNYILLYLLDWNDHVYICYYKKEELPELIRMTETLGHGRYILDKQELKERLNIKPEDF